MAETGSETALPMGETEESGDKGGGGGGADKKKDGDEQHHADPPTPTEDQVVNDLAAKVGRTVLGGARADIHPSKWSKSQKYRHNQAMRKAELGGGEIPAALVAAATARQKWLTGNRRNDEPSGTAGASTSSAAAAETPYGSLKRRHQKTGDTPDGPAKRLQTSKGLDAPVWPQAAFVALGKPILKMVPKQLTTVMRALDSEVLNMGKRKRTEDRTYLPGIISKASNGDGTLRVVCADPYSLDWLTRYVTRANLWHGCGGQLRVVDRSELPRQFKIWQIFDPQSMSEKALKAALAENQRNAAISGIPDWHLLKRSAVKGGLGVYWEFRVGEGEFASLKAATFYLYLGARRYTMRYRELNRSLDREEDDDAPEEMQ